MPRETKKRAPRRKAEQRAESMEQILDAAEFLFSKNGLYGVTLSDVAKRVGIHTTLVHYYFQDKQTLFEAVFADLADGFFASCSSFAGAAAVFFGCFAPSFR